MGGLTILRAIIVDDEQWALDYFSELAKTDDRIELVGAFAAVEPAIQYVRKHQVDLAFLDIEMPGVGGLGLAKQLRTERPGTQVIFTTAHSQHTLQAFGLHASGYLLKPFSAMEIKAEVDTVLLRAEQRYSQAAGQGKLTVKCFGGFSCYRGDWNEDLVRWRTSKSEELFAFLLDSRDRRATRDVIVDTLWRDMEPEKAVNNLHATCSYLRTALTKHGFADILIRERSWYQLDTKDLDCDMLRFTELTSRAKSGPPSIQLLEEVSGLYTGEYLAGKAYEWAGRSGAWLEREYVDAQHQLAGCYAERGDLNQAIKALCRALEINTLSEQFVAEVIELWVRIGDKPSAINTYRKYQQLLWQELGVQPAEELQTRMHQLLS